ncbi:MAG TPA: carbohydrate kinase family protein [Patescibacteria group bacterium]|nr:carbohydrate kinase family protein [Patescibacteria group bacterium]
MLFQKKQYDMISIGDATQDVYVMLDDACVQKSKRDATTICLPFGEKIPIKEPVRMVGGNAANVAFGCKRLGLSTAYWGVLGDDDFGVFIRNELENAGVNVSLTTLQAKSTTNYSTILLYRGERTILSYHAQRRYTAKKLPPTRWVYLTSMAQGYEKIWRAVIEGKQRYHYRIAINPGSRQVEDGLRHWGWAIQSADVLIVNKHEAQILLSTSLSQESPLLKKLHALGCSLAVITHSREGACGYDGTHGYRIDALPFKAVDSTGAGDSFASGLLSSLALGNHWRDALKWGILNSGSVVSHIGPHNGLLNQRTLHEWEKKYKAIYSRSLSM